MTDESNIIMQLVAGLFVAIATVALLPAWLFVTKMKEFGRRLRRK